MPAPAMESTRSTVTHPLESTHMLVLWAMSRIADVALSIPCLVALEVAERLRTALREGTMVSVPGVVPIIHVSVESMRAMKPWSGSDKHTTREPIRPVVTIRCAVIRSVIEVAIRAYRRSPNAERYLGRSQTRCAQKRGGNRRQGDKFCAGHLFSSYFLDI
jgi:hypothetical protein